MSRRAAYDEEVLPDRLIAAGEALFARHGFDGVSLRQICVAAGAKNNFAVQYHFGSLESFTAAIVAKRSTQYEVRRGELLAVAARDGPLSARAIVEILAQPIIEHVDDKGEPVGARFMVALQGTSWGWRPLGDLLPTMPVTRQLVQNLEGLLADLPPPVIWQRLYLTSNMILNCVAQTPREASPSFRAAVIENVFGMAAAGVCAPLDSQSAKAMCEFHERGMPEQITRR